MRKIPDNRTQHPLYGTWIAMRYRCKVEPYYAGKGIKVCRRWENFWNFVSDMGPKPTPLHSIDRENPKKGYNPKNCRWATDLEQGKTRTDNRWIEFNGRRMILADWSRETGIGAGAIMSRLNLGWPIEKALTRPVHYHRPKWSRFQQAA
jgi:hypothetical protein